MKTYKGYELIKAIEDGEIKEGSKFKILRYREVITYIGRDEFRDESNETIKACWFINTEFELIEENTIDIQRIEELETDRLINASKPSIINDEEIKVAINKLTKVVKQLDREIKELKEAKDE